MSATRTPHATLGAEPFRTRLGRELTVRRLRPDDQDRLKTFISELSPRSRYFRFFSALKGLDPDLLRRFVTLDFVKKAAFVATDQAGAIQAVGQYYALDDTAAEVAFAVADEFQGEGVGTELLDHLASHARKHGILTLIACVLAENEQMLDVLKHSGYPFRIERGRDCLTIRLELDSPSNESSHRSQWRLL